ncbi:MAG: Jag family protein [cyanobacterium endosymbiont of Rhopalodia musculus]|uniref:Jag family protein n=1 Tax=cyanobacterium endosymbiont of Epithemia clementina EcSB TaxID=3034674 RepID=UPI00247FB12C|nr:R3H domain-containing nucleic acid-binding protein [cyanobacterium endosymbiont of Epithemia clementina EcSB]WGT66933.1 R3H domain-containing nucleic acid-binding protein [cyanobacterium endosymbiont of Epithemia clementina EcSB]
MEREVHSGKAWLETLLTLMGLTAQVKVQDKKSHSDESPESWLTIDKTQLTPQQTNILLREQGAGIDAIQYLANTLINLSVEPREQQRYTVELNGYRLKRQEELVTWAQEVVQQVRQTGREVEMSPLSSAERRQIHTLLKDVEDVETESRGQEPDRRLVVKLR